MNTNYKSFSSMLQYLLNNNIDAVYYTTSATRCVIIRIEFDNFFMKFTATDDDYNVTFAKGNYSEAIAYIKSNNKYTNKHTTNGEFPLTKESIENIMVYNFIE